MGQFFPFVLVSQMKWSGEDKGLTRERERDLGRMMDDGLGQWVDQIVGMGITMKKVLWPWGTKKNHPSVWVVFMSPAAGS